MYMYIPKHNLLGLYNIICVYVFRTDHPVLTTQSVYSFVKKTISPTLRISDFKHILHTD